MSQIASFYLLKDIQRRELSGGDCPGAVYVAIWDWCENELVWMSVFLLSRRRAPWTVLCEKSENDELAGYISDDFGLIADNKWLGYSDEWLEKLISCYENARIPCGEL